MRIVSGLFTYGALVAVYCALAIALVRHGRRARLPVLWLLWTGALSGLLIRRLSTPQALAAANEEGTTVNRATALLSHPFLVFAGIVAVSIAWRVIRLLWAPQRGQLSGQDLAVLLRAALLKQRNPGAAEAMVRAQFEPRVREEEAARAVLWSKVNIDREAAQDLRRRVLNDIRVHEAHSTQLSQQEPQDAGELVKVQAALAKARAELERLDTILARPRDD